MKNIEYYMNLKYRMEIIEDQDEGGYVAYYPELPGCMTCAETVEEVITELQDAKREWITAMLEDGMDIAEPDDLSNYSGQFKLRIPKSLHKALAEQSKREGISMNQYCVYLLSSVYGVRINSIGRGTLERK
jgi:predicted RNase H-like HicB family nuclease